MNVERPIGINDSCVLKTKQSDNKTESDYKNSKPFHFLFTPQKMVSPKSPPITFSKISYQVKYRKGNNPWYISSTAPSAPVTAPDPK